ncbi:MAG TPA: 2-oxoglutarate dehydrogenase, E2 component, dihydrolipoamide succinyltransferase [Thermoanaerobaculia bacterium]|nr:2-oxoglutarate dehydrogenase, E2 component, dihydrolipoamide succinyltransferase [Thermoanaerobaculia bacterium]
MPTDVVMPQMGESIAEGTITKWLVKVGDRVERDQPLFEISTDKVDAEIPSPSAGVLLEIEHKEGETVPVNQVVAKIGEAGEQAAAAPAAEAPAPPPAPAEGKPAAEGQTEVQREETAREGAAAAPAPGPRAVPPLEPRPAAESGSVQEADEESGGDLGDRLRKFSSPLVRNIAAKEGVNLEEVEGTGAHGRVTKQDILSFLDQRQQRPAAAAGPRPAPTPAPGPAPAAPAQRPAGGFSVPAYVEGENVEIEPMSKIRQITAAHMVYSKATSAHVTTVFHIDMSKVARARNRAKDGFAAKEGTKLTFMPFIFKAVVNGLKAYKKLNASIDGTNIVYKKDINLGMAVDLGHGLIVPVIKHADQLSLSGLAKGANDLADRARNKKLKPDEVQGGTFTITNPGVFGSLFGTPVINQPQVAILGVGAVEKRPVVIPDADGNDSIAIKTMCYFAITYDHRLVDGADADRFMIEVKKTLETDTWTELDAYS